MELEKFNQLADKLKQEQEINKKYNKIIYALSDLYQNVYLINVENATLEIIKLNGHITYGAGRNKIYFYDNICKSYVSTRVIEDDADTVANWMKLENVVEGVAEGNCYELRYRVLTNGKEENYQGRYFYVDDEYIVCGLQNIDVLMAAEERRNQDLHNVINKMTVLNDNLSEHIDIISNAGYGIWHIILKDGSRPRMQVNEKMAELLGIESYLMTEEEIYASWYDYITPEAIPSVQASVKEMMEGRFSENTYKWEHSTKGIIYVRCGGTSIKMPDGSVVIRGYHTDVTDIVKKEQTHREILENAKKLVEERNKELTKQLGIINTVAKAFNSIYYVDMREKSFVELGSELEDISDLIGISGSAYDGIERMCNSLVRDDMKDMAREFMNIDTIIERLQDKTWTSCQLCGPLNGWFEAIYIAADRDDDGKCNHIIFATRDIDDVKRREAKLIYKTNTDEMTHMYNRRAYEEDIKEYNKTGIPDDFVYVSIDINGLKVVNDSLGHEAGDELIMGACVCMIRCFGHYGKIYRTGGDEFIAMLNISKDKLEKVKKYMPELTARWRGKMVKELTVSCGYVARYEAEGLSMHEILVLADQKMYDAKELYYKSKGIDRKGQKDAHIALSLLYSKILKINITDDTYQILNIGKEEDMDTIRNIKKISEWFSVFANSDMIHPDDANLFLAKTNAAYLKTYFSEGRRRLSIIYRKKYDDEYKETVTEIIPANDYSEDKQVFFLYVKRIAD